MILLDTDHLTVLKYSDSERCRMLQARLAGVADESIGVTIISVEEQMRGWLASIARERQVERQVSPYRELSELFRYFDHFHIALLDEAAVGRFHELRAKKVRIGTMDLKIASIALSTNALHLSANLSDFQKVSGLRCENWLS